MAAMPPPDEHSFPLCSAYLLQLFHSPIFLTAHGHNPTHSHTRILTILADPSTDQDDRIDAVRSQLEACLRLNPNSNTSSANAARRASGGTAPPGAASSSSPSSIGTNGDTKIPDEHLDDLVLELMHRHQQDCSKLTGTGSSSSTGPRSGAAFRPPRPQPQIGMGTRIGGGGGGNTPRSSDLSRTLSSGSTSSTSANRPSSSSGLNPSLTTSMSTIALGPGSGSNSPRPWTPSSGGTPTAAQTGVFGAGTGQQGIMDAFSSGAGVGSGKSPFASPGSSPRLWTRGLPLPLGDAGGGIFRPGPSGVPSNPTSSASSSTSPFVSNPWSSPPAFSISTPNNSNTAALALSDGDSDPNSPVAADLQRTSSDLGGEPTSPNSSRGPSAGGIGRTAPGAPGSGVTTGVSSNAQPFARLATANAAAKAAAAAAAAAAASKTTAIGSERDTEFSRPRWGSASSSTGGGGQAFSDRASERRPSEVDEDTPVNESLAFSMENTDGRTSPERRPTLGSSALGGESPSPKRSLDTSSKSHLTASASSSASTISAGGEAPGSDRTTSPTSTETQTETGSATTPALSSSTSVPSTTKAASVSSNASTTASPRLNVAAAEFKPRLTGSGSPGGGNSSVSGSGPGTPPRFGNRDAAVPVPGAEAGGAAWYGYALAAAAASTSPTPSPGVGAFSSSSPSSSSTGPSAGAGGGLLSSSPGSGGMTSGMASPPISPSPSHAYARSSVRPTPLRKQVGTDDDEEDDELHLEDGSSTVQYATYPMDGYGMPMGYGIPPTSSSSHGSSSTGPGRKSHEHEEDDEDEDEFSPFGSSRPFVRTNSGLGGGGGYGGHHPGSSSMGPGMASSLVARMMAGTGSPLGPSRSRGPGSVSGSPTSYVGHMPGGMGPGVYQGEVYEYGASPPPTGEFGGSPGGFGYRGGHPPPPPPPHGASPRGAASHMQYLQGQLPSTGGGGGGGPQDVFSASYQPHSGGMYAEDGSGGAGVSDAEFNELEAAIEAEEAERRRANMTPFDVLYSILNGTGENSIAGPDTPGGGGGGGDGARKSGTRWTPKQIETALSRNGWDVEATLNWIMAGGMNSVQQGQTQVPSGTTNSEGGAKAGQEGGSTAGGGANANATSGSSSSSSAAPGVTQGPLSSSLSSSASSSLSSSAGTGTTNSISGSSTSSTSTSATSATPRAGSTGSVNGNGTKSAAAVTVSGVEGGSGAVSAGPAPPSTSLPHFVHHYIPGSTKPAGFASPRAMFSVGQAGMGGNGSNNMARSGSGASGATSGNGANAGSGSGGGGAGSGTTSFRPISYSNGVAVLPREAFQSHKGGVVASSAGGGITSGSGTAASGSRSPRIGSPSLFHMNISTSGGPGGPSGPLTPSHFGASGSSPLPSPGLNGPTTPGGSGGTARVCRYFLAGECRRFDCRFSHDLGRALCRFWLRGQCLNDPCGFLHDYDIVNKLARGMKSTLSPSAGSTPGEASGADGYFAQRPGGGSGGGGSVGTGDALGSPGGLGGGRWTPSGSGGGGKDGSGPNWTVGRSGSYRDRVNQDGSGASPGTLDFRGLSQFGRAGSGGPTAPAMMAVPDADAPDEFPVLGRPSGREDAGKKAGTANRAGGGPRWVLASSGAR